MRVIREECSDSSSPAMKKQREAQTEYLEKLIDSIFQRIQARNEMQTPWDAAKGAVMARAVDALKRASKE